MKIENMTVSVPIRGLFNLTKMVRLYGTSTIYMLVSVPIRGLFNLTRRINMNIEKQFSFKFPSPSGDYLI